MPAMQLRGNVSAGFWLPVGAVLAVILGASHLAWQRYLLDAETSLATPWWMVLAPVSIVGIALVGAWNDYHGHRGSGRSLAALSLTMACYQLALTGGTPAVMAQLSPLLAAAVEAAG